MQILKKTHSKTKTFKSHISVLFEDVIESLEPETTFVINDLFLHVIHKDFSQIDFYLFVNGKSVSYSRVNVEDLSVLSHESTKDIYNKLLNENIASHLKELSTLQKLVTMQ